MHHHYRGGDEGGYEEPETYDAQAGEDRHKASRHHQAKHDRHEEGSQALQALAAGPANQTAVDQAGANSTQPFTSGNIPNTIPTRMQSLWSLPMEDDSITWPA
jgi:hypothetical protein